MKGIVRHHQDVTPIPLGGGTERRILAYDDPLMAVEVSFETGADTYEIQQFEASEVKNVGRRKKGPGASATISPEEEAELKKITD